MSTQTKRLVGQWTVYTALLILYIGVFILTLTITERILNG